jgi:hypothetical protein
VIRRGKRVSAAGLITRRRSGKQSTVGFEVILHRLNATNLRRDTSETNLLRDFVVDKILAQSHDLEVGYRGLPYLTLRQAFFVFPTHRCSYQTLNRTLMFNLFCEQLLSQLAPLYIIPGRSASFLAAGSTNLESVAGQGAAMGEDASTWANELSEGYRQNQIVPRCWRRSRRPRIPTRMPWPGLPDSLMNGSHQIRKADSGSLRALRLARGCLTDSRRQRFGYAEFKAEDGGESHANQYHSESHEEPRNGTISHGANVAPEWVRALIEKS